MMDLKEVNERLNYYIRPQSFPLAIKLLGSKEKLPQKARIPSRDLGYAVTVCQRVAMARHYGWIVALGKEDVSCAPAHKSQPHCRRGTDVRMGMRVKAVWKRPRERVGSIRDILYFKPY